MLARQRPLVARVWPGVLAASTASTASPLALGRHASLLMQMQMRWEPQGHRRPLSSLSSGNSIGNGAGGRTAPDVWSQRHRTLSSLSGGNANANANGNGNGGSMKVAGRRLVVGEDIRPPTGMVRLIDDEGKNHGIVTMAAALEATAKKQQNLSLLQLQAAPDPDSPIPAKSTPVCKMVDIEKYVYDLRKDELKKKEQAKMTERANQCKEIKVGTNIDNNDMNFKLGKVRDFLGKGHMCRLTIVFRRSKTLAPSARKARAHDILREAGVLLEGEGRELVDQRKATPGSLRTVFVPATGSTSH